MPFPHMKRLFLVGAAIGSLAGAGIASAADITGAGATFPYPIYAKWAAAYKKATGTGMNYQSIGSGGGIKQISAKTVDFGASDKPLKPDALSKGGLMQFPAIMGGVVPVINVKGIGPGQVKLTGALLKMRHTAQPGDSRSAGFRLIGPTAPRPHHPLPQFT